MAAALPQPNFSPLNSQNSLSTAVKHSVFGYFPVRDRRKTVVIAARCCLNLPLEPMSPAGKSLVGVLQNDPDSFYDAVSMELNRVAEDRDSAFARFNLSLGSPEASLHRRIVKLKESECQHAVEDVLYSIILYKFSEIRVPLVPSISQCLYNSRLEILPSKDWELESIHSLEDLELVRDHLTAVLGWKVDSGVSVNWSTTKVKRVNLSQVYLKSVLYGYFLKAASLRFKLEQNLPQANQNVPFGSWMPFLGYESYGVENVIQGQMVTPRSTSLSQVHSRLGTKEANLGSYILSFDQQTREECAKLKSKEAVDLIENHCRALFTSNKAHTSENDEWILTSISSLKRLVLEAVAFGGFVWDAEQCVNGIYKLTDNN